MPKNERLWGWWGLSYASWLTIPRVLMHEMPDDWQERMAALLEEYDTAFPEWPDDIGTRVQIVDGHNKFVKMPSWLSNYRHPDYGQIDAIRGPDPTPEPVDHGETDLLRGDEG